MREEIDKIIRDMKDQSIIKEFKSPWMSPAVLVKKRRYDKVLY